MTEAALKFINKPTDEERITEYAKVNTQRKPYSS